MTFLLFVRQQRVADIEAYLNRKKLGCKIICLPIPEGLCDKSQIVVGGVKRDWLVGALQYLHLAEARRRNADFHAINPNAMYASGFFREVMRVAEGESAVLSAVVWIDNRGLIDRMPMLRGEDGSLEISPIDLTSAGLSVSASTSCTTFTEGFLSIRGSTAYLRVTWAGKDCIDVHSTCHEIVFLARKSLHKMPDRFFIRPSTEIDRILDADTVPHFVTEDDGIAIAEFAHPPGGFCDVGEDSSKLDAVTDRLARPRQAGFFKRPVRLAISRKDVGELPGSDICQSTALRSAFLRSLDEAGTPVRQFSSDRSRW